MSGQFQIKLKSLIQDFSGKNTNNENKFQKILSTFKNDQKSFNTNQSKLYSFYLFK